MDSLDNYHTLNNMRYQMPKTDTSTTDVDFLSKSHDILVYKLIFVSSNSYILQRNIHSKDHGNHYCKSKSMANYLTRRFPYRLHSFHKDYPNKDDWKVMGLVDGNARSWINGMPVGNQNRLDIATLRLIQLFHSDAN
jgi:hypothetical protein